MAVDATIELGVKPVLDRSALNAVEKELRSVRGGAHSSLTKRLASIMAQMVRAGEATTATQARIALSNAFGDRFSPMSKSILRRAQNIAQIEINKESSASSVARRLAAQEQKRYDNLTLTSLGLQYRKGVLTGAPTSEGKERLLSDITGFRQGLLKLYIEYRRNGREVPAILKQIAQNTSSLKKEVNDLATPDDGQGEGKGGVAAAFSALKRTAAFAAISKVLSFFVKEQIRSVLNVWGRGLQAIRLEAAYGRDVDWAQIRKRAGLYNISNESAASTDIYASDFQQRMMWGELSEREIIGLSRAGRWGKMVMSGEARRNPEAAAAAFREMVETTDQPKMRSILRQIGLPQELMNYNIPTDESFGDMFVDAGTYELEAAKLMWDAANKYQAATEYWSAISANDSLRKFAYSSPKVEEMYRARGGTKGFDEFGWMGDFGKITPTNFVKLLNPEGIIQFSAERALRQYAEREVRQQVTNNITINGNIDADNIDSITEQMSAELAKSNYESMANAIGARTSF